MNRAIATTQRLHFHKLHADTFASVCDYSCYLLCIFLCVNHLSPPNGHQRGDVLVGITSPLACAIRLCGSHSVLAILQYQLLLWLLCSEVHGIRCLHSVHLGLLVIGIYLSSCFPTISSIA